MKAGMLITAAGIWVGVKGGVPYMDEDMGGCEGWCALYG